MNTMNTNAMNTNRQQMKKGTEKETKKETKKEMKFIDKSLIIKGMITMTLLGGIYRVLSNGYLRVIVMIALYGCYEYIMKLQKQIKELEMNIEKKIKEISEKEKTFEKMKQDLSRSRSDNNWNITQLRRVNGALKTTEVEMKYYRDECARINQEQKQEQKQQEQKQEQKQQKQQKQQEQKQQEQKQEQKQQEQKQEQKQQEHLSVPNSKWVAIQTSYEGDYDLSILHSDEDLKNFITDEFLRALEDLDDRVDSIEKEKSKKQLVNAIELTKTARIDVLIKVAVELGNERVDDEGYGIREIRKIPGSAPKTYTTSAPKAYTTSTPKTYTTSTPKTYTTKTTSTPKTYTTSTPKTSPKNYTKNYTTSPKNYYTNTPKPIQSSSLEQDISKFINTNTKSDVYWKELGYDETLDWSMN